MSSKMTTKSQPSTSEPKETTTTTMKTKTKQTTRTGTESQKWTSHGGFSVGRGRGRMVGKGTGNKHNWQAQSGQGEVKNAIGNREVKELICTTHGHELSGWRMMEGVGVHSGGG